MALRGTAISILVLAVRNLRPLTHMHVVYAVDYSLDFLTFLLIGPVQALVPRPKSFDMFSGNLIFYAASAIS